MECRLSGLCNYFGVLSNDRFKESRHDFTANDTVVMIVNSLSLNSKEKFGHWVLWMKRGNKGWFFDSLGEDVEHYFGSSVIRSLQCSLLSRQNKRIQGFSSHCGLYCLCFALHMLTNDFNMQSFIDQFSGNLTRNDILVQQLFQSMYRSCL